MAKIMKSIHIIPGVLIVMLLWLHYHIWLANGGLHSEYKDLKHKTDVLQKENEELSRNNRILKAEVESMRQGAEALSETVRSRYGYIREGETLYQLKPE